MTIVFCKNNRERKAERGLKETEKDRQTWGERQRNGKLK